MAAARSGAIALLGVLTNRQATVMSYLDAFRALALLLILTAPFIWAMRRRPTDLRPAR
jgi:hypothetical protein